MPGLVLRVEVTLQRRRLMPLGGSGVECGGLPSLGRASAKGPSCEQMLEVSPMSASPHRALGEKNPVHPSPVERSSQVSLVSSR